MNEPLRPSVRDQVAATVNQVLVESGRSSRELTDADSLTGDLALDSLDLAVVVVQLEQRLGVDPFRNGARGVRTFGDLVTRYAESIDQ
jgi:acyl carrier protein